MTNQKDLIEYKKFLIEKRKLTVNEADQAVEIIKKLKEFSNLKDLSSLNKIELMKFINHLMQTNQNTEQNILALLRYNFFINNKELVIALYELIDGAEVLGNLSDKIKNEFGEKIWQEIFKELTIPKLGDTSEKRPIVMGKVVKRLKQKIPLETCQKILASGLHGGPATPEFKAKEHEKFLKAKNIDDFLLKKHNEYLQYLESLMKEDKLYFTQEITPEVFEFVRNNPMISGVRKGKIIEEIKIPYNTKEYLQAKNDIMKRYHYCHCMWVKEAIKNPKIEISPTFCYCSAGFHQQFWEAAFNQPVKIDVVETVLNGDFVCKFVIQIPENLLNGLKI